MRRRAMVGPRRGPGLVGTMARTAVIAGTATAVSKGVSGHMDASADAKAQQQDAQQVAYESQAQMQEMQAQMAAMQAQQAQQAMLAQQAQAAPPPPPAPVPHPRPHPRRPTRWHSCSSWRSSSRPAC